MMKKASLIWFLTSLSSGFVYYFMSTLTGEEDQFDIVGVLAIALVVFLCTFYSPLIIHKSQQLIKSKATTANIALAIIISYLIIIFINPFTTIIILNTLNSNETTGIQYFLYILCVYAFLYHKILLK